jgi:hypothetical protein
VPALESIPEEVGDTNLNDVSMENDAAAALAGLTMEDPPTFSVGGRTEDEHVSHAQKRWARHKRAKDNAHKLRRSTRLMAKEEPGFELPEDKATHVQQAKFHFALPS